MRNGNGLRRGGICLGTGTRTYRHKSWERDAGDSFKNNDHLTSSNVYTAHEKRKLRTISVTTSKLIIII